MNIHKDLIATAPIPFLSKNGVIVHVLRLDKIHPVISGNKWFKLRFYLQEAKERGYNHVATFGGAYSNHIVAAAAACAEMGFKSTGIIRGGIPEEFSHTLKTAVSHGMKLIFTPREAYRQKLVPPELNDDFYIIPEGGYGKKGADGAATIPYNKAAFDTVCCAVGTGTMMAGLMNSKSAAATVLGFSVLKNNLSIGAEVKMLLKDPAVPININHEFHFGGYAKHQPELIRFMNELFCTTGIPTDFVYTAKLFYGVSQLIDRGFFKAGSRLLLVHSGGIQGNLSMRKGTLIF